MVYKRAVTHAIFINDVFEKDLNFWRKSCGDKSVLSNRKKIIPK